MSRINVDSKALGDPRFGKLARRLGLPDHHSALGRMIRLWWHATETGNHTFEREDIALAIGADLDLEDDEIVDALIASDLAEEDGDLVYVRGTRGRIEWLSKKRKAASKAGKASGKSRRKKTNGGGTSGSNENGTSGSNGSPTNSQTELEPTVEPSGSGSGSGSDPSVGPPKGGDPPGLSQLPATKRDLLKRHLPAVRRLWELQDQLRGKGKLKPTAERLLRVAQRLEAGVTEAECERVLRHLAAKSSANPEQAQWFNGTSNWRPENFDRTLGMADAGDGPSADIESQLDPWWGTKVS